MQTCCLKYQQSFKVLCCIALICIGVNTQDQSEYRCLQYKMLLYEETKTISYLHADATGVPYIEDHCKSIGGFVVGGEKALPKEFPFAARLGYSRTYDNENHVTWLCGGTLISAQVVLTAAHCLYSSNGVINRVLLGELDFSSTTEDTDPEDFNVQKLIEHPDYVYPLPYNDIGLVILSSMVMFNQYKHPACLPPLNTIAENQNTLTAIGWGHTKFSGQISPHLQKVSLKTYSHTNCAWLAEGPEGTERLPFGLINSLLCAGSSLLKDTCQGDSGGPLLIQHPLYPCMQIVVGITSMGIGGCATPNVPALYTRVSHYLNWIHYYL